MKFESFASRRGHKLRCAAALLLALLCVVPAASAEDSLPVVPLNGPEKFWILVWPYGTDLRRDYELWRGLGVNGFEIDHGKGKWDTVAFAREKDFPYYAGHAAGKGILHLTGKGKAAVVGRKGVIARPNSLAAPQVVHELKRRMTVNMTVTGSGPVLAHALDDEISLGSFTNPADVDALAIPEFREWLEVEYGSMQALNAQWETDFEDFGGVLPMGFEGLRRTRLKMPWHTWNLSPWLDFRRFMDRHFARVLRELVDHGRQLDPDAPVGIVGGQVPGPWGGYDYALLSRAVQWLEAYDNLAVNELVRSWFHGRGKPHMLTFFPSGDPRHDEWFLWYHLCHGARGVIVWPEKIFAEGAFRPEFRYLANIFSGVNNSRTGVLMSRQARIEPDPIGIYYSQSSLAAGWVLDAMAHGDTWPKRLSSIDTFNQSMGVLRQVWCETLEDLGFQYDFVSGRDVREEGAAALDRFRVLILPQVMSLSAREAEALHAFVERGGVLVTDALPGVMDGHGRMLRSGALDGLFGVRRNLRAGLLGGDCLSAVDGERYAEPFPERLECLEDSLHHQGLAVAERGLAAAGSSVDGPDVAVTRAVGVGQTWYLNLAPHGYLDPEYRTSAQGGAWRNVVRACLRSAGLQPRVVVSGKPMLETVFWTSGTERYLCVVSNPALSADETVRGEPGPITLEFRQRVCLDGPDGRSLGCGTKFEDVFTPWKANIYRMREDA